jgi:DNA invertase Pin-like site-specific DNA recombinase
MTCVFAIFAEFQREILSERIGTEIAQIAQGWPRLAVVLGRRG